MATIGLRDLFYSPITEDEDGIITYGTPVRLAKAITVALAVTTSDVTLYADDGIDEQVKEFTGGTITVNINDLTPDKQAILLGQSVDEDGVVFAKSGDEAPWVALAFKAGKTRKRDRYVWLHRVKFGIPNENYNTKGATIAFQTPTIVGTIAARSDGIWKADHVSVPDDPVAVNWFEEVRMPNSTTNGQGGS